MGGGEKETSLQYITTPYISFWFVHEIFVASQVAVSLRSSADVFFAIWVADVDWPARILSAGMLGESGPEVNLASW